MNKKLLCVAVSAALVAPAAMAGDVTMYGQVHIATSSYDADRDSGDAWDISSHASRLGFKGSEDLGGSLKAIWQIELGIDASDDEDDGDGGNTVNNADGLGYRNTFVGLSGNWGTALIGRHDTPMKISTGSLDLFADTIADYNNNGADDEPNGAGNLMGANLQFFVWQGLGFVDLRVDQAIAYVSPNFNGLTVAGAIVQPGMDRTTGVSTSADGFAEAYSVAAMYSNGPFYASLAWEQVGEDLVEELVGAGTTTQLVMDDDTRWRMGLGYTGNGLHVGLVYENQNTPFKGADAQRWQISGSFTFGNNVAKVMYGENEFEDLPTFWVPGSPTFDVNVDQWAIGLDHNFSKRTKAYVAYTDVDTDFDGVFIGSTEYTWDGFSLGLVHKF
jgi:predicted porin